MKQNIDFDLKKLQKVFDNQNNQTECMKKMLIVEDNAKLLKLLEYTFSDSFEIFTVQNGRKGVEFAITYKPDMIITDIDIDMPIMNGKDMCVVLKSNETTCHIPIITISAHNTEFDQIEALKLGIDDYVAKPLQHNLLKAKVEHVLKKREEFAKYLVSQYGIKSNVKMPETNEEWFVKKVTDIIEKNISSGKLNVDFLASKIGYSKAKLYRKFAESFNQKPGDMIKKYKLTKAYKMLRTRQYRVAEVAYECGFNDPKYFARCFLDEYKFNPSDVNKRTFKNAVIF